MVGALEPAFAKHDLTLRVIDWEAPIEAFEGIDIVLLGTAWNYQDKESEFLAKLEALEARGTSVFNRPGLVRWNSTKTYLRDLEKAGARIIPTLWLDDVSRADLEDALQHFDCDKLVVKRQVGAGALGQELIAADDLPPEDWRFGHAAMVQPFLPAIAKEGELSFIFIDGMLSHTLRKSAASGEYRIQSMYGGTEEVYEPSASEIAQATAIVECLPISHPLYARIDMLRGSEDELLLMEAELIEPYLYPEQGPELGERLAIGVKTRLG